MSDALKPPSTGLGLSSSDIGLAGAVYVAGACIGALFFGQLTDRFGRKKLFMITLGVYTVATVLTAFSMNPMWYFACRFLTGAGIGGEYAAINSAIDELIPAKYRGRIDIAINGSFWVGAAAGALLTIPLLDPTIVNPATRLAAAPSGSAPSSRSASCWSGATCRRARAGCSSTAARTRPRQIVRDIERTVEEETGKRLSTVSETITIRQRKSIGLRPIAKTVFTLYPKRTILCFSLFVGQAFLYNAFFFTYGDSLSTTFLGVKQTGYYIAIFAVSNFIGALLLSPLFDSDRPGQDDRRHLHPLRACCSAWPGFMLGDLTAMTLTIFGMVIFFFASAGASAAYLTASEVFPMETRALCIAFFYAIGTAVGGITGPLLLRQRSSTTPRRARTSPASRPGYFIGAALMIAGGIVEIFLGVKAEGQSLENIAKPLTAEDARSRAARPSTA